MLINAPVQKYGSDVLLGLQQIEMTFQPQRLEDVKNEEQFILFNFSHLLFFEAVTSPL